MGGRWWRMFRGLAVPTVLFLAPIVIMQEVRPMAFYLGMRGAVAEVALELLALILLEAALAAVIAIAMSASRALGLSGSRAEEACAGMLAVLIAIVCGLALFNSLGVMIGAIASVAVQSALIAAAIAAITALGWRRVFARVELLNSQAQAVLAVFPVLVVLALTGGFGWRRFDAPEPAARGVVGRRGNPNLVLISFDALSAQDMSLYGYPLATTPEFERLARRSYNFVNFYSTADFTTPAAASMLTGQYPLSNRVFQLNGHVPERLRKVNLAWILKAHGYTTAAIVTNPAAHPLTLRIADSFSVLLWPPMSPWFYPGTFLMQIRHSILFNAVNHLMVDELFGGAGCFFAPFSTEQWVAPRAVFASAEDFIRGARAPYFLWIHIYPPHAPYVTDAKYQHRFQPGAEFTTQADFYWRAPTPQYPAARQREVNVLRRRYDASIADCDAAMGRFLDWMAAENRGANTLLIVTADHGENFTGGWWSHMSPDLHYAETHVPLLISLPGQSAGQIETGDGDLTDIAPTALSLLGVAAPAAMDGHPLIGAGAQPGAARDAAYSMYLAESNPRGRPQIGAIAADSGPYHLVWYFPSGHIKLFDIVHDPGETHYAAGHPEVAMRLLQDIQRHFGAALAGSARLASK